MSEALTTLSRLPAFAQTPRSDNAALLNRVLCCDALELLRTLATDSIDMALTSPPYDNLRTYKGYSWDFEAIARESYRVLKPGGVLVWVVGDSVIDGSESLTSFKQAIYFREYAGFRLHDTMIWNKPASPGVYGKRCEQAFEYMFVLSKGVPKTWYPPLERTQEPGKVRKRSNRRNGFKVDAGITISKETKIMQNVWRIPTEKQELDMSHPAVFPPRLAVRHILTWSNPGDTVLDFFGGSGTTAKMARANGRNFIICDISSEYCELMTKRLFETPYTPPLFDMPQAGESAPTQLMLEAVENV